MKSLLIAAVLVLISTQLHGEPMPWMKTDKPETLRYSVQAGSDCPVSTAALEELVTGVLIRSRLKPQAYHGTEQFNKSTIEERIRYFEQERFGFSTVLQCMEMRGKAGWFIYQLDIAFVRFLPDLERSVFESEPYGAFGTNDEDGLKSKVKERVEELVADYLQANFALTPE